MNDDLVLKDINLPLNIIEKVTSLKNYEKQHFLQKKMLFLFIQKIFKTHPEIKLNIDSLKDFDTAFVEFKKLLILTEKKAKNEISPYFILKKEDFKLFLKNENYHFIEKQNGDIKVFVDSHEKLKKIGSSSWCITYDYDSYESYIKNTKKNHNRENVFYIIFKTKNKDPKNIIGVTSKRTSDIAYNWDNEPVIQNSFWKKSFFCFIFLFTFFQHFNFFYFQHFNSKMPIFIILYLSLVFSLVYFLIKSRKTIYFCFILTLVSLPLNYFNTLLINNEYHNLHQKIHYKNIDLKKMKKIDKNLFYSLNIEKEDCLKFKNTFYKNSLCFYRITKK